jgi:hypothetical protein
LGVAAVPAGWTSEGQLWSSDALRLNRGVCHLSRYDLKSHRILEERTLSADATGLAARGHVFITPDSRNVAYEDIRVLSYLYLLDGLAPALH